MKVKWEDDFPKECYSISASKTKYLTARKIKKFIRKVVKEERKECLSGNWVARKVEARCADELEDLVKKSLKPVYGFVDWADLFNLCKKWRGKK